MISEKIGITSVIPSKLLQISKLDQVDWDPKESAFVTFIHGAFRLLSGKTLSPFVSVSLFVPGQGTPISEGRTPAVRFGGSNVHWNEEKNHGMVTLPLTSHVLDLARKMISDDEFNVNLEDHSSLSELDDTFYHLSHGVSLLFEVWSCNPGLPDRFLGAKTLYLNELLINKQTDESKKESEWKDITLTLSDDFEFCGLVDIQVKLSSLKEGSEEKEEGVDDQGNKMLNVRVLRAYQLYQHSHIEEGYSARILSILIISVICFQVTCVLLQMWFEGWNLRQSAFFVIDVSSTVGFGTFQPETAGGKLVGVALSINALLAIFSVLTLIMEHITSDKLVNFLSDSYSEKRKRLLHLLGNSEDNEDENEQTKRKTRNLVMSKEVSTLKSTLTDKINWPLMFNLSIVVIWTISWMLFFHLYRGKSWFQSFYIAFGGFTTGAVGDIDAKGDVTTQWFVMLTIYIGVINGAIVITELSEIFQRKRLGLVRTLTLRSILGLGNDHEEKDMDSVNLNWEKEQMQRERQMQYLDDDDRVDRLEYLCCMLVALELVDQEYLDHILEEMGLKKTRQVTVDEDQTM